MRHTIPESKKIDSTIRAAFEESIGVMVFWLDGLVVAVDVFHEDNEIMTPADVLRVGKALSDKIEGKLLFRSLYASTMTFVISRPGDDEKEAKQYGTEFSLVEKAWSTAK